MAFSPFGDALRAVRDSALMADASGIHVKGMQWAAFVVAGLLAGLAGALYVFSKGSTSPEVMTVGKSVDGLVMVLLGGIQTLFGPVAGAAAFTIMQDYFVGITEYWRALRSEEHTSELKSLMRISYAVFCLKKKKYNNQYNIRNL